MMVTVRDVARRYWIRTVYIDLPNTTGSFLASSITELLFIRPLLLIHCVNFQPSVWKQDQTTKLWAMYT